MTDIDLDSIRARDAKWHDKHPLRDGAARDRRLLLQYIDEIRGLVEELSVDIKLLRSAVNEAKIPSGEQPGSQDAPGAPAAGKLPP